MLITSLDSQSAQSHYEDFFEIQRSMSKCKGKRSHSIHLRTAPVHCKYVVYYVHLCILDYCPVYLIKVKIQLFS